MNEQKSPAKILLLYPPLGFVDKFVKNVPLSLVYCATESMKSGYTGEIVDFRIYSEDPETILREKLTPDVVAVGISVMSGLPTTGAVRLSRLIRKLSSAKIIWGGPHPTILPNEAIEEDYVDFVIRGYGSKPLKQLLDHITGSKPDLSSIAGLCYRSAGKPHIAKINAEFEFFDFRELPYFLLESTLESYFEPGNRVFPIYSSAGCPYQCTFCISPIWYKGNKKKWIPLDVDSVLDHMEFLIAKFRITFFYFYDDDSFVDVKNFLNIAKGVRSRNLGVKIGVRGIRVNELEKLKDEDFALLEQVGISTLHIGLESGSQRMLDLMGKNIKVEKSLEMNRRLAKFPNIIPMYNLLSGFPTETMEDLVLTKNFMIQLCKDNPKCVLFGPSKLIPYPGSEIFELALLHGFTLPKRMEDWGIIDQENDIWMPWYTKKLNNYVNMLAFSAYILDNRINLLSRLKGPKRLLVQGLKFAYLPIAWFRLRTGFASLLFEYPLMKFFLRIFKL